MRDNNRMKLQFYFSQSSPSYHCVFIQNWFNWAFGPWLAGSRVLTIEKHIIRMKFVMVTVVAAAAVMILIMIFRFHFPNI